MKIKEESFGIIPLREEGGIWYVLVILHVNGWYWAFPKGHANPGETFIETACRELFEETGLIVKKILQDTPLVEKFQFYSKRGLVSKTVRYFPALVDGIIRLQEDEIKNAKWVVLKDASDCFSFKESKEMCNILIAKLNL
jgi:bis(5'-nucleosidyl)-tetraphosphatase